MNWKEIYCKKFGLCDGTPTKLGQCNCKKELNFISKEIIEKLIDDIPDDLESETWHPRTKVLKQQLRDKWLEQPTSSTEKV